MITLEELSKFLDDYLKVNHYSEEVGGIYSPSNRPIHSLGLALEATPELPSWVNTHALDALFLHRPWKLDLNSLGEIGVLAYHLPFDERLTIGFNPRLAAALGLSNFTVLGEKEGRAIGMIGDVPCSSFSQYCHGVKQIFGGVESVVSGSSPEVKRVAVVGAMTEALVREAAAQGARVYITGQFRKPASAAVQETGMSVIEVGHRRCEMWGLTALSGVLQERFSGLEVLIFSDSL